VKFCYECSRYLPLDYFRSHSGAYLGVRNRCASCEDEIWQQTHERRYERKRA
jgi:hypothetical protein